MLLTQVKQELLNLSCEWDIASLFIFWLFNLSNQHSLREVVQNSKEFLVQIRNDQLSQKRSFLGVDKENAPSDGWDQVNVEEYYHVVSVLINSVRVCNIDQEVKEVPRKHDQAADNNLPNFLAAVKAAQHMKDMHWYKEHENLIEVVGIK